MTTILHPLEGASGQSHEIVVYEPHRARRRMVKLPSRPPLTFPLDLLVPLVPPAVDCWFALNSLACARGLLARRLGRAGRVAYWCIDFVPDRFGEGRLTRVYDSLDALCCTSADARFELSEAALEGRNRRHALPPSRMAPAQVVPMGAWVHRVPRTPPDGWRARRVIFAGGLVERQGVDVLITALGLLAARGVEFGADVIGRGPLDQHLRGAAHRLGLDGRVEFHGFVPDAGMERLLSQASVAVAPYATSATSFTRFADPGKLKAYLAAGLPIVTTDVPPNADELQRRGGAEVVDFEPEALADALERGLASPEQWQQRRLAALTLAATFDWPPTFARAVAALGFSP